MPNSKSRKVAARQAQLRQRAKHKARKVTTAPQYMPPTTPKEAAPTETTLEVGSTQEISSNTPIIEPMKRAQPKRQDRTTDLLVTTSNLKTELLRIGTVSVVVVGVLVGLRFGTNLGA